MTVGQRLREAREAKGLSLEDIAAQTRIPTRHLDKPRRRATGTSFRPPTYTIGFAKNYAGAVGLDRDRDRRPAARRNGRHAGRRHDQPEVFEPADPARTMPKGLVVRRASALLLLVALLLSWLSNRSLEATDEAAAGNVAAPAAAAAAPRRRARRRQGPVVLTANEPVWIEVKDGADDPQAGRARRRPELRGAGHRRRAGADHRQARGAAHFGRHRRCAAGRPGRQDASPTSACKAADLLRGPAAPRRRAAGCAAAATAPAPAPRHAAPAPPPAPAADAAPSRRPTPPRRDQPQ